MTIATLLMALHVQSTVQTLDVSTSSVNQRYTYQSMKHVGIMLKFPLLYRRLMEHHTGCEVTGISSRRMLSTTGRLPEAVVSLVDICNASHICNVHRLVLGQLGRPDGLMPDRSYLP